jgi:glycosyltransferase involved in cell wall biosynthesis
MRILHLTDRLTDRGGAHRHLLTVVRAQAARGDDVHIGAGSADALDEWVPATIHAVPGLESRTSRPVDLGPLLRRVGADVLHVHTVVNPAALERAAAERAVFTVQDHRCFCPARGKWTASGEVCRESMAPAACAACFEDRAYRDEMWALTGARLAAIREATVIVLSEYMRGELVAAGLSPRRVQVVPPLVDFPAAEEEAPSAGPPCVLFVGRLVEAKGPLEAVQAWRASGVPLPLVVAGTGPLRERVAAAGAEVLGWLAHHQLPSLLRRARALLMPPRWQEPFGIAGLEALRFGVPVVAWESGGVREWHPGPLAAWGDIDGLARALKDAIVTRSAMPAGFGREDLMQRLDQAYSRAG